MSPNGHAQGERLIVDAARAGDAGALSELYTLYFPRVYRYILARTGNTYDAEDLAEEVFREASQRIDRNIRELTYNRDALVTVVGKQALTGTYPSLSEGIIQRGLQDYLPKQEHAISTAKERG